MKRKTIVFALIALTLLVVALSTGTVVYYLMAFMMLAMLILALGSALMTLFTLRIETTAQKKRTSRGEQVGINIVLRRRSIFPVGMIELEISSPEESYDSSRIVINSVPMKGRLYRYAVKCAHRGIYEVGVSRVSVADVFGLFTFSRRLSGNTVRIEVFPRTETVEPMTILPGDTGPQGRVRMTEDMASPSGVRAWQEGDGLKKVHWKLTARRRELMVRTFEESAKPDLLILMDCSPVNAMHSRVRTIEDVMCEAAASAALAQLKAGYTVRMPLNTASPTELAGTMPGEIGRFLDALVWLKFDSPYSFEQVLALEMRRLQRTGAVILVSTHLNASVADMALRMKQLGVQVQMIWAAENVHSEYEALREKLEFMGIRVERASLTPVNADKAPASDPAEE